MRKVLFDVSKLSPFQAQVLAALPSESEVQLRAKQIAVRLGLGHSGERQVISACDALRRLGLIQRYERVYPQRFVKYQRLTVPHFIIERVEP